MISDPFTGCLPHGFSHGPSRLWIVLWHPGPGEENVSAVYPETRRAARARVIAAQIAKRRRTR